MKRALLLLSAVLALGACVERKMIIKSEPGEADLWVNRAEAPVQTTHEQEFVQHGVFAIRLEKEGYFPLEERARVTTPWYSWPILDLVTDLLLPFTIKDHHEFTYRLTPVPEPKPWDEAREEVIRNREEVMSRADEMRKDVMGTTEFHLDLPDDVSGPKDYREQ